MASSPSSTSVRSHGIVISAIKLAALIQLFLILLLLLLRVVEPPLLVPFSADDEVLAEFLPACLGKSSAGQSGRNATSACPVLGEGFFFGLATAPAHVEDELDDAWLDFARGEDSVKLQLRPQDAEGSDGEASENPPKVKVHAWRNQPIPEQRLRFWSEPEVEVDLAAAAGVDAIRMGVDWGRIVIEEPVEGTSAVVNWTAVARYRDMLQLAKSRGLRVMLTLFHHSFPKWGGSYGGWLRRKSVAYFAEFAALAASEFGEFVDYWVTFNEPTIFSLLTYCAGVWPPGYQPSLLQSAVCFSPIGDFSRAMRMIGVAHIAAFEEIKRRSSAPIGVAHNTAFMRAFSSIDLPLQIYTNQMTLFSWPDQIVGHLHFLGINYYGQEFLSLSGLQVVDTEEYSEAGRAVYPDGLFRLLVAFHDRYKQQHPELRLLVTENGMADETDVIRPPYFLEHLLALHAAIKRGVPVDGYFHWTISDNWEWADGYCPKFGLVAVNRSDDLKRTPRPSYDLLKQVVADRRVVRLQREEHWASLQGAVAAGSTRPFCRAVDNAGRMWADSLDNPTSRAFAIKNWRFGEYLQPSSFGLFVLRQLQVYRGWLMTLSDFLLYFVNHLGDNWRVNETPSQATAKEL